MTTRPAVLQDFIDRLSAAILLSDACDEASRASAGRFFSALAQTGDIVELEPLRLPVCANVEPAIERARQSGGAVQVVAEAFARLEQSLVWGSRGEGPGASGNFLAGHAGTSIIGTKAGLERRDDVSMGVSLLAPQVRYPDHHHPPEEVYYVLSPGSWWRGEGEWFEPGPGGIFYNEPHILHAMRSADAPLLAIWCLYAG